MQASIGINTATGTAMASNARPMTEPGQAPSIPSTAAGGSSENERAGTPAPVVQQSVAELITQIGNNHTLDPPPNIDPPHHPGDPFVERYPVASAGAPLNNDRAHIPDMEQYMRTCGTLADPDHFDVAELLMTTGLSNKGKDRHLKSNMVSRSKVMM